MQDEWMTVEQIADSLKVDGQTVRRWLRDGKLPGKNFGGKTGWRIKRGDVDAYLGGAPNYQHKLDALLAAVIERPDSAAILARAKELEAG